MGNEFMKADASLERDLQKAATPEEIRELLERAVSRSNLGVRRDEQTGRFVSAPTAENPPAEEQAHVFSKKITINGNEVTVEAASELELERQVGQAYKTAAELRPAEPVTPPSERRKSSVEIAQELLDREDLDRQFHTGLMTTEEYLERTHAVDNYLAAKGLDVDELVGRQLAQSWSEATDAFLQGPGADWPGGAANLKIIGLKIQELGLMEAPDKVAALTQAYKAMKDEGIVFQTEPSEEQILAATEGLTPQQILEQWKNAQGSDPDRANQEFMRSFSSTGSSSSLFGK